MTGAAGCWSLGGVLGLLETSAPGVFAVGDVRSGSVKRAAAAVSEGSIAVRFVSEHLGRRAGLATPALVCRPA